MPQATKSDAFRAVAVYHNWTTDEERRITYKVYNTKAPATAVVNQLPSIGDKPGSFWAGYEGCMDLTGFELMEKYVETAEIWRRV